MTDFEINIVQKVILEMGGYSAFARLMGSSQNSTTVREIAEGKRVPAEITRLRMVKVSRGRLTESDIIGITGKEVHQSVHRHEVDPMWDAEEGARRHWIWKTSVIGARKQRINNRRRKT